MFVKGLLVFIAGTIVGVAYLGYHPLPEGIADIHKVQIQMGIFTLSHYINRVKEVFGYGSFYRSIKLLKFPPKDGDPETASLEDLKVSRAKVAGVPVIIYQPKDTSMSHPGIIFFHGGGWVLLNPDYYDRTVYTYALQTRTVIISVDYRLAQDHPFPAPVEDCLDVTRFVLKHGNKYNIDVTKVGVAGDSAGGNLAAAVALQLSREKSDLPPLRFQVLHYPALQAFDMLLPSLVDHNHSIPILSQSLMSVFYAYYMGLDAENMDYYAAVISENRHIPDHFRKSKFAEFVDVKLLPVEFQTRQKPLPKITASHDEKVYAKIKDIVTNPLFSPLMSPDLSGLPPAFVHVAEFDILRDDALLYARRLQDAGVKTDVHFGKGGFHGDASIGFTVFGDLHSISGQSALSAAYNFIKKILNQ